MKQMRWGNWRIIIIAFLLFSSFLGAAIYNNYHVWTFGVSVKSPGRVPGVVKDIEVRGGRSSDKSASFVVYTEYIVEDESFTNTREINWNSIYDTGGKIRLEDVVEVLYDPAAPGKSIINDVAFKDIFGLPFAIMSAVGILICFLSAVYKIYRDAKAVK
jgi:hypothetical protein